MPLHPTKLSPTVALSLFALLGALHTGCVTTEEMGGNQSAGPQPTVAPIDTAQLRLQAQAAESSPPEPSPAVSAAAKKAPRKPSFVGKRDTIVASVVRRSKNSPRPTPKIERPENPAYTVQIGAFSKAPNALLLQKIAKERFSTQPVFNNFNPADKLYRISVGRFDDRQETMALRREMMKSFPKDYTECWVNYIAK